MKIAVINDLSGMGHCSLMASVPVLSVLGHQVFPVPTAILSNQTGYPKFSFVDFSCHLDEYVGNWKDMGVSFDCVYSGFLANKTQVKIIEDMHQNMCNGLLVVDPVMGDGGHIYATFDEEICQEIKKLAKKADLVTPNVTEACILADINYHEFMDGVNLNNFEQKFFYLATRVKNTGCKQVVITGFETKEDSPYVYNFVYDGTSFFYTKNKRYGGHYSGTGDMMASIITGEIVKGKTLFDGTKLAADFVEVAVKDAFTNKIHRNDGVNFEQFLHLLIK